MVARARGLLHDVAARPEEASVSDALPELRHLWGLLGEVEKHYRRKENLVFSCLERHFIFGPSRVMWGKDDEVRAALRACEEVLAAEGVTAGELAVAAAAVLDPALEAVDSMVFKESAVLFPMISTVLTEREWAEIWEQPPDYGWCLVEPQSGYVPAPPGAKAPRAARVGEGESLAFPTGNLEVAQLRGLLGTLPLDVTPRAARSKSVPNLESRSRIVNFDPFPSGVMLRSCCAVQRSLGSRVTTTRTTSFAFTSITTKAKRGRNQTSYT